jgi:hypothetical protein
MLCVNHWRSSEFNKPITRKHSDKPLYSTKAIKATQSIIVEEINEKRALNEFYESQEVPLRCENCNKLLNAFSPWARRCVTAHILGKADFTTIATNPDNRMFLGVNMFSECGCHSEWDNSDAAHRKTMKCYPLAVERVNKFLHLLPLPKQVKAEKYLGLSPHIK